MVAPTNVRFPDAVDQGLADYARQAGAKKSTVVVNAVREWLRMQTHAGIIFVPTITGELGCSTTRLNEPPRCSPKPSA